MSDYISREALAAHFRRLANEARAEFEKFGAEAGTIADTFFDAAADVKNFPAADVPPVRYVGIPWTEIRDYRGRWGVCAECGYKNNTVGAKYCGGCGAKLLWRTNNG